MESLRGREAGEVVSGKGLVGRMIDFARRKIAMVSLALLAGCSAAVTQNGDIYEDDTASHSDISGSDPDSDNDSEQQLSFPCETANDCIKLAQLVDGKSQDCLIPICDRVADAEGIVSGHCDFYNMTDDEPCDDGDKCTLGDKCEAGLCVTDSVIECKADENPCTNDECDPGTGLCNVLFEEGTSCEEPVACVFNGECSADGECLNGPLSSIEKGCDDSNVCTQDYCSIGTGCQYTNYEEGKICGDKDDCHIGPMTCSDGECVESDEVKCPDDFNVCNGEEVCDVSKGGCTNVEIPLKGTPCTLDNDKCTLSAKCGGSYGFYQQCLPDIFKDCDDGDPCTIDTCDPASGDCAHKHNDTDTSC